MAAIYSNGGNRWNILGFNFTKKRDALSSVYKISMVGMQLPEKYIKRQFFSMSRICNEKCSKPKIFLAFLSKLLRSSFIL